MKKSLFIIITLLLFPVMLLAENNGNNRFLLDQIQEVELKKKNVIEAFENSKDIRKEFVDETAAALLKKRNEIDRTPYRVAELQGDGTPSDFAVRGRENAFNDFKYEQIKKCKENIENEVCLTSMLSIVDNSAKNLKPKTINTLGNELTVKYSRYNGKDIGWDLYVTVKTGDVEEFKTESFLSYTSLTGEYPVQYGNDGFDEFCDKVDYYEALFRNNEAPFVFELTYNSNAKGSSNPSEYDINFYDFKYYDPTAESSYKKELELENTYVYKQMTPVYNLYEISNYYSNLTKEVMYRMEDLKMKELGLYSDPEILPKGTDGSCGTKGTYVLFGYWPQTIKADDVTIDTSINYKINGWDSYKGSDNNYYVRIKADIYSYNDDYKFSNGTKIEDGKEYYFKIERIKWRILTNNYQENCLLLSEIPLLAKEFDDYSNNYQNSSIREWLIKDFLNKGFSFENIERMSNVIVDNSAESSIDNDKQMDVNSYNQENTKDKIFLLSEKEVTTADYGFKKYNENDSVRVITVTDFGKATGIEYSNSFENESENNREGCDWWLRSSSMYSDDARYVSSNGHASNYKDVEYGDEFGIVPALAIPLDKLGGGKVSDLNVTALDTKLMFSWTNPENTSFDKAIISLSGFKDIEIDGLAGEKVTKVIGGLETGKKYSFEIKTVDKNGNFSQGLKSEIIVKDKAPDDVKNLIAIPGNKKLNLIWEKQEELDIKEILVNVSGLKEITLKSNGNKIQNIEIRNLSNDKEYTVTVKVIDNSGKTSKGLEIKVSPSVTTDFPILLPEKTAGTFGKIGTYVLFGDWPQTLKADDVTLDMSKTESINGWDCYLGSDDCYYVMAKGKPNGYNYKFTNGNAIEEGVEYYFKLEPVKWRVLTDNYQDGKLLLAENVLLPSCYYPETYDERTVDGNNVNTNNYKYSVPRAMLNGLNGSSYKVGDFTNKGFINKAFSLSAIEKIKTVTVDNSKDSIYYSDYEFDDEGHYACENTEDKIFLLSEQEVTSAEYGFKEYGEYDNGRKKISTDYSKAIGVNSDAYSWWGLRSPESDYNYNSVKKVSRDGSADDDYTISENECGIVPALSICQDQIIKLPSCNVSLDDGLAIFPLPEVSDLIETPLNNKITFSWTNPSINNFEKVIISIDGFKDIEVTGEKGAEILKTVGGLESGKEYNFTIKIADKNGNISNGIKIKSIINDSAPGEVIEPVAILGKNKIKIEWTNPSDLDFEKVLISGIIPTDIVIKSERLEKKNFEIKNIKNIDSLITLKTVDKAGNVSEGITIEPSSLAFTKDVILLPAGTDGSVGTKGRYVLFGEWPQTIKADDVTIETDETEYINGWDCYHGSDDCYYVKVITKPYNDDYYYHFSNGEKILDDKEVYFKLEPIKWRIVTNDYQGGKLLLAENIIVSNCYNRVIDKRSINGKTVYANNYKYSTMRAYLNGLDGSDYDAGDFSGKGFIDFAFSPESIDKINTVKIDNSYESTTDNGNNVIKSQYYCEDTYDKIFLLSEEEITNNDYGFASYKKQDIARQRQATDYAKATGAFSVTSSNYKNNGWWGLRSPDDEYNNYGRSIGSNGMAFNYYSVNISRCGVVPALSISF